MAEQLFPVRLPRAVAAPPAAAPPPPPPPVVPPAPAAAAAAALPPLSRRAAAAGRRDCTLLVLDVLSGSAAVRRAVLGRLPTVDLWRLRRVCTVTLRWVDEILLAAGSFELSQQLARSVAASADCLSRLLPRHGSALRSLRLGWAGAGNPVCDGVLHRAVPSPGCGAGGGGGWRSLETLSLRGCGGGAGWGLCDAGLQSLLDAANPPQLRHLDLADCSGLASLCPVLSRTVALHSCVLRGLRAVDDDACHALATACGQSLTELDLSYCPAMTGNGLASVGHHCSALRTLKLSGGPHLADEDLADLLASAGASLACLQLHGCCMLNDITCAALARWCPDLQELALSGCTEITDAGLVPAVQALGLRSLAIAGLLQVTDATTMASVKRLRSPDREGGRQQQVQTITALDVARCKRVTLLEQWREIFDLRALDLTCCPAATSDDALRRAAAVAVAAAGVVKTGWTLSSFCALESLSLRGSTAADGTLANLLSHIGGRLQSLDIREAERAGDTTATAVAKTCVGLTKLFVSDTRVTDLGLAAILSRTACNQLKVFGFAGCNGVQFRDSRARVALAHLLCHSESIRELDVSRNYAVTDEIVKMLCAEAASIDSDRLPVCTRLELLDISGCMGVSTKPFLQLLRAHETSLRVVGVKDCPLIDVDEVVVAMPASVDVDSGAGFDLPGISSGIAGIGIIDSVGAGIGLG
jgi:hypothetical protein